MLPWNDPELMRFLPPHLFISAATHSAMSELPIPSLSCEPVSAAVSEDEVLSPQSEPEDVADLDLETRSTRKRGREAFVEATQKQKRQRKRRRLESESESELDSVMKMEPNGDCAMRSADEF